VGREGFASARGDLARGYDREMNQPLVTVATFTTAVEGNLAKGCLQAAGIPAFLKDGGMAVHLTHALGAVTLQVVEDDAEDAREILRLAAELER